MLGISNKLSDSDGPILILDVDTDDENFILINLHNPNTEAEQLKALSKLTEMLTQLHLTQNNNIICAGDSNLSFNIKLEGYGGNPVFKKRSNLHFENKLLKDFPFFYKQVLMNWKKYFIASPITLSWVLSQFLWYSSYIKIDNKAV